MKTILPACAMLLLCFCFSAAKAQTDTTALLDTIATDTTLYFNDDAPADSSFYDMGRIRLQKKFTQGFTIKGADLEKMPFMDLKEALAVYYNGIYGPNQKFTYIINGMLNTDINAFSIFDIDEITFVQNAAMALNGVLPSQVLVLVKTKRGGPGEWGINVNAQTNAVTRYVPYIEPNTKNVGVNGQAQRLLYQQYNISAYTNSAAVSAGLSVNMQRNAFPAYRSPDDYWDLVFTPYKSYRIKAHGFVDVRLDEYNTISLNAGYVPQRDEEGRKRLAPVLDVKLQSGFERVIKQNLLYANLDYKTTIAERITNKLSAGIQRYSLKGSLIVENAIPISDTIGKVTNYTIKDDIDYRFELGDFVVTPQLNLTYRNAVDTSNITYFLVLKRIRGYKQTQSLLTATPSISFNLKDIFNVQIGAQRALFSKNNFLNSRIIIKGVTAGTDGVFFPEYEDRGAEFNNSTATPILPFATVSVDLLKTAYRLSSRKVRSKPYDPSNSSLMLYGSFARTTSYAFDVYGALSTTITERPDPVDPIYEPYNTGKAYNQIQGGLTYALLKKGLSFSYNYNNSKFVAVYYVPGKVGDPPADSAKLDIANIVTHRLGINFSPLGNRNFKWTTSLNGALITNKGPKQNYYSDQLRAFYEQVDKDLYTRSIITGGFVNQLTYKRAYFGFNILYGVDKARYTPRSTTSIRFVDYKENTHVLNLQSVYLGYQLKMFDWIKSLDIFVNGRNLWQNYSGSVSNRHYAMEENRYFGGGFKLAL